MENNIKTNIWTIIIGVIIISVILYLFTKVVFNPREVNFPDYGPSITISTNTIKSDSLIAQKLDSLIWELKSTQKEIVKTKDSFLSISNLHDFYATLIAFITLIAVFFGFISWNRLDKMKDKAEERHKEHLNEVKEKMSLLNEFIENYETIKKDVDILREKKDLAQWVDKKMDTGKSFITHKDFIPNEKDRIKIDKIINCVSEDIKDSIKLKRFYAKKKLSEKKYDEVFKIYKLIEMDIPLIKNSDLPSIFYHMYGQLFWEYYKHKKDEFYNTDKTSYGNWEVWSLQNIKNIKNEKGQMITPVDILMDALFYYNKVLDFKAEKDAIDTLDNLVSIRTELAKFGNNIGNNIEDNLRISLEYLVVIDEKNIYPFITYWDRARVMFFQDKDANREKTEHNLELASRKIRDEKQKMQDFFLHELRTELEEKGFPYESKLIEEIKLIIDRKQDSFYELKDRE